MCSLSLVTVVLFLVCSRCFFFLPSNHFVRQNLRRTERKYRWTDSISKPKQLVRICLSDRFCRVQNLQTSYCCCCFSHSAHWLPTPKKTTLHGGQSRSWSAEQGKKKKKVWQYRAYLANHRALFSTDSVDRFYKQILSERYKTGPKAKSYGTEIQDS